MKNITIIIKPTLECNFRCKYCYHADTNYENGKMSIALFEEIIKKTFPFYSFINIIFHGGEPLLLGFDFFEKAIDIIKKYKTEQIVLKMCIQTNGYFLDEKFMRLFKENGITTSVSFDGPNELNSLRDKTKVVTDNIIEYTSEGYKINLLGVVSKINIDKLQEYYIFAKKNGCHLKLNPIFKSGNAYLFEENLIEVDEYITAIKNLFLKWIKDSNPIRQMYPLYNLTNMAITGQGNECTQNGCLSKFISISYDGLLYPCGRSYSEEYCLGNIKNMNTISEAFLSENFKELLKNAIYRRDFCKNNCNYFSMCGGGCNNDSILAGDIRKPNEFNCEVYRKMIPYINNFIKNNNLDIQNPDVLYLIKKYNGSC